MKSCNSCGKNIIKGVLCGGCSYRDSKCRLCGGASSREFTTCNDCHAAKHF